MAHSSLFELTQLTPIKLEPGADFPGARTRAVGPGLAGAAVLAAPVGGGGPTYQLSFRMQRQNQDNWCWAAVSVSVSAFYLPTTPWTQCSVVSSEVGDASCCTNGSSKTCNVAWALDSALTRTNNLQSWANGPLTAAEIQAELGANRVICCRIGWQNGGGHFVSISGYQDDGAMEEVTVDDPWYGSSTLPLQTFLTAYHNTGSWTHSYFTR